MRAMIAAVTLVAVFTMSAAACRQEQVRPTADAQPSLAPPSPTSSAPASASLPEERDAGSSARDHAMERRESPSPESFAASMTGTLDCDKGRCRAGREVCVSSPNSAPRCLPIVEWVEHRTPEPRGGSPPMAGISACAGSHNCPAGTVCCLHEIGLADVQAVVCHASLDECRDKEEICREGVKGDCRTPGTKCEKYRCVPR